MPMKFLGAILRRVLGFAIGRRSSSVPPPSAGSQAPSVDPDALIGGLSKSRSTSVEGVELPHVGRRMAAVMLDDGRSIEHVHKSLVVTADGSITDSVEKGYALCMLCWQQHAKAVTSGKLSVESAITKSLCSESLIQRSELSGAAVCPLHARRLAGENGTVVITSQEADELAWENRLRAPIALFRRLMLENGDGQR